MKKKLLSVLLTVCMTLTLLPVSALAAGDAMTVKIDDGTPTTYQSFEAGWNAAVGASGQVAVKLLAEWTAAGGSFGTGAGFGNGSSGSGGIRVPVGKTITLDLNGKTIDRGLTAATAWGSVIRIEGGSLTIMDSSTADFNSQGKITGAYNYDGGAVDVMRSYDNNVGFLTMTGGIITGNKAVGAESGTGGGVYSGTSFRMTGGEIFGNFVCGDGTGNKGGGVFFYNTLTLGTFSSSSSVTPSIGVTTEDALTKDSPVTITT